MRQVGQHKTRVRKPHVSLANNTTELLGVKLVEDPHNARSKFGYRGWLFHRFRCDALAVTEYRPTRTSRLQLDIGFAERGEVLEPHIAINGDLVLPVDIEMNGCSLRPKYRRESPSQRAPRVATHWNRQQYY